MRGNRNAERVACIGLGPIPACAGQPAQPASRSGPPRAYPRVCGATDVASGFSQGWEGLSPRVRGNHKARVVLGGGAGPIPACAGQPAKCVRCMVNPGAYPRVCGAAAGASNLLLGGRGLSPRVRGNRYPPPLRLLAFRPIPACAGQPGRVKLCPRSSRAYPRVCGATEIEELMNLGEKGLSPRVRGNLFGGHHARPSRGPIPACAGQPFQAEGNLKAPGAYPRVCGAT